MASAERLISVVRKLLALSRDKAATPAEAALAAERAQDLIELHNLDPAAIDAAQARFVQEKYRSSTAKWRVFLMSDICKATYCRMTTHAVKNGHTARWMGDVTIVGEPHNVEVAIFLYEFLTAEINRMADIGWTTLYHRTTYSQRSWKEAFRMGAQRTIGERLAARHRSAAVDPATRAIVLDRTAALDRAWSAFFPEATSRTVRSSVGHAGAYAVGGNAARRVPINDAMRAGETAADRLPP